MNRTSETTCRETSSMPDAPRGRGLRGFFTGVGLPVFLLAVAVVYEAFLLAVLFAPPDSGPWSSFAEEFKVWCFSYDPRTGGMEWGAVWVMLLEPFVLAGIVGMIYRRQLVAHFFGRDGTRPWRSAVAGGIFASVTLYGLVWFGSPDALAGERILPFPGERIRSSISPPEIRLRDHNGEWVDLADLRGDVVLVTGVYATCSTACPMILREVKDLIETLPAEHRGRFHALALSLDPHYDTTSMMRAVATAYGFPSPGFHYMNGTPEDMRPLLTHMQFSPILNEKTGIIDHANLFILIDASGKIAYRFNLDPRHRPWLQEAALQLLDEAAAIKSSATAQNKNPSP